MEKVSLLIDEDYINEFMNSLPKNKVIVVEENFKINKELFANHLEEYKNGDVEPISYYESSKNLSTWLDGVN